MDSTTDIPGQSASTEKRARRGRTTGGIILVALGALFLLRNFYPWFRFEDFWPVILIVIGGILLLRSRGG